jgi:hypothetical protein
MDFSVRGHERGQADRKRNGEEMEKEKAVETGALNAYRSAREPLKL